MKLYSVVSVEPSVYNGVEYACYGIFSTLEKAEQVKKLVVENVVSIDPDNFIFIEEHTLDEIGTEYL